MPTPMIDPSEPAAERAASQRPVGRWPLAAVVAGALAIGVGAWRFTTDLRASGPEPARTWFAPYVDATLRPVYPFEGTDSNPAADAVLSFVVSDPVQRCTPSWGGSLDLPAAGDELDLDNRVAHTRARGGDVVVSFGGAASDELATTCTDIGDLTAAYRSVIDRYALTTVDFAIDGTDLGDSPARQRRATALATIQHERRATGRSLAVWLSLPSSASGLSDDGVAQVDAMLNAGVDLAGVNLMTMDLAGDTGPAHEPFTAITSAVESAEPQLDGAYRRAGHRLAASEIRHRIGITPMIGHNDATGVTFTLDDAHDLVAYVRQQGFGRLSMWSLNRDRPCRPSGDATGAPCSGIEQTPLRFTGIFDAVDARATAARTPG